MSLKRLWSKGRNERSKSDARAATDSRCPGWEYLLLSRGIRDAILAHADRCEPGAGPTAPGTTIDSLQGAVRHVSLQAAAFRAIIGDLSRLFGNEVLDTALGKPGEDGRPKKINELATDVGEVYGLMLAWAAEVRGTEVPPQAKPLYEALARCASRPLEEVRAFADRFVSDAEEAVSQLQAGRPPAGDVVIALRLTIDPEALKEVELELDRLAGGASQSDCPTTVAPPRSEQAATPGTHRNYLCLPDPAEALARGVKLNAGDFAAIDFETATRSRASACAVGVASVTRGRVTEVKRWLVRPPGNEYESINISIHGITPKMTAGCADFSEVWPEVFAALGEVPVVAHYAAFDIGVLRASLAATSRTFPTLTYLCTCVLSRHAWPGWLSYRLDDVAHACGVEFQHHEAGDDASTAAQLGVAFCGATNRPSILEASRELGVWPGELRSNGWMPCGAHPPGAHPKYSELRPTVDDIPEDGLLYGKTVVFTGSLSHFVRDEAAQLAVNAGAHVANNLSRKVDYLVCGMQDARVVRDGTHSMKMLKATELNASGGHIELLSEVDFYHLLQS